MERENDIEAGSGLIREGETAVDFTLFETERLFIREFNIDDVNAVLAYSGDPENMIFIDGGPETREEVTNFIHLRLIQQIVPDRTMYDLALCLKETGELIGGMGLFLTPDLLQAQLGYTLNKRFWGKGYCTEAALAFLRFGFLDLDLHRISAACDSLNKPSEAVLKRIGMRFEGEARSAAYVKVHGRRQWRSQKQYAMLQREYLARLLDGENGL